MLTTTSKHNENDAGSITYDERFVFHFASEYRDRGWPVIPLDGKKPALSSWKEFQERRPTLGELGVWFGGPSPIYTNMGLVTGKVSGIVVVDCDSPEATEYWSNTFERSPLVVQTGGGGSHHYYQMPKGVELRNRVRINGRRIDVRANGGYIVAPPSRHPNGTLYSWVNWGDYSLSDVPVLDPVWLQNAKEPADFGQVSLSGHASNGNVTHGRGYISRIHAVSGEGGSNATFRAACKLRDAGLTADEALTELLAWNERNAEPPWTEKELIHKVRSAYQRADL